MVYKGKGKDEKIVVTMDNDIFMFFAITDVKEKVHDESTYNHSSFKTYRHYTFSLVCVTDRMGVDYADPVGCKFDIVVPKIRTANESSIYGVDIPAVVAKARDHLHVTIMGCLKEE